MSEQDIFILSERALADVIGQIRDDQWEQQDRLLGLTGRDPSAG